MSYTIDELSRLWKERGESESPARPGECSIHIHADTITIQTLVVTGADLAQEVRGMLRSAAPATQPATVPDEPGERR